MILIPEKNEKIKITTNKRLKQNINTNRGDSLSPFLNNILMDRMIEQIAHTTDFK